MVRAGLIWFIGFTFVGTDLEEFDFVSKHRICFGNISTKWVHESMTRMFNARNML